MDISQIAITRVHGCLVANMQVDLTPEVREVLRDSLLQRLEHTKADGVVLDFSGLTVMDVVEFEEIRKLVETVEFLGARCVVVGLNPGIVRYLVMANANTDDFQSMLGLEDALRWLAGRRG